MSMLGGGLVRVEDAVDIETRFYHASFHLDHRLRVSMMGFVYCKGCNMKYRKVKKDIEIPQEHEDFAKNSRFEKDDIESSW